MSDTERTQAQLNSIREDGAMAAIRAIEGTPSVCPYEDGTEESRHWHAGWKQAMDRKCNCEDPPPTYRGSP